MRKLLILIIILSSQKILFAQQTPLRISFGYVQTEAERQVVNFDLKYINEINNFEGFHAFKNGTISYTPYVDIKLGSGDAFNGIVVKYSGLMQFSKQLTLSDGTPVLQFDKYIHVIPISLGIETEKTFNNISGIFETGYVPWFWNFEDFKSKFVLIKTLMRDSRVGVFIQGGYKFNVINTDQVMNSGGDLDESAENPDDAILRLKLKAKYTPKLILSDNGFGFVINGEATTWFDLLNSKTYYNVSGVFSIFINSKTSLDFGYIKGSGAPNFNQGEQFIANLTIAF